MSDLRSAGMDPASLEGDSALSLIERKTALRILLIGALATLALWIGEGAMGVAASHDVWAQPALACFLLWQHVRLRRDHGALLSAQRQAAGGVATYFMLATVFALALNPDGVTTHWLATNFMWLPVISLLMHLTFPWRWAASISVLLTGAAALPAVWLWWYGAPGFHSDTTRSLIVNGLLMQITFLVSLIVVERFRHGIGLIVAGERDGPTDARQALAAWLNTHTEELARARDAAEAASKAKSRFLAVMSHELRTPLHAMLVSADLLADKGSLVGDAATEARLLRTIQSSGQHLLSLIDQVLEMSRIEAGRVEAARHPLDLRQLVQRAQAAVRPMAELKGLALEARIPDALPAMRLGDELRLTQVLINLMANACKFTTQGHVRLTVDALPETEVAQGWLRLSVEDTGPGMDEAEQRRVFEPFYQADTRATRQHGGAGLGLTISRELVLLMGGRITLHSRRGLGTCLQVDLPLPVLDETFPAPTPPAVSGPSLQGQLVLVVDDDEVNRMLIGEVLRGAGARVHTADNGQAALDHLRSHRPAVVLMDWRMPGMDGLTATLKLREGEAGELSRDVPVIGLTANAFAEDRHACLAAGMNEVMTKPVDRHRLLAELAHWAETASPPEVLQPRELGPG